MKTTQRKILSCLLTAVILLCTLPSPSYAAGKTVSVDDDGTADFTTIQEAVDHIAGAEDSTGWIIQVMDGTYDRFTVPHWNKSGISDLTIVGESRTGVVIRVLDEAYSESALIDNGGINIYGAGVTLKNMTIQAGTSKQAWDDAAISTNHGMSGGKNVSLTVENCTLIGPGIGNGASYGIFWACSELNVTGCSISGFANAIEYMNDGFNIPAGETFYITDNTIADASFAIHGYMGGGNGGGILLIANNTITGTDALRAKIICQDNSADSFAVDIRDNTFTNALVGLVNLEDEGDILSDVLASNALGDNCFYVEAIEPGTLEYYTTYMAPAWDKGCWVLNSDANWESTNPGVDISVVKEAIRTANETGSNTLSITGIEDGTLIKTFTWLKDMVYWVSKQEDPEPSETPSTQPTQTPEPSETPSTQPIQPSNPASPSTGQNMTVVYIRSGLMLLSAVGLLIVICWRRELY